MSVPHVPPRIAAQYVRAILAVCGANPKQLAAVIPHLMRVIHEYQLGQNKSIPVALKDISGGMGHWNTNPDVIFSSDYVAEVYTKQSKQLYNFLARQLDAPFRTALRPYLIDGSGQKTVQAVEGDIVTISFVLLDMHEASSWKMKQVMREYYTQAPTKIMSERNIRNCLGRPAARAGKVSSWASCLARQSRAGSRQQA